MLGSETKTDLIHRFQRSQKDTGSAEVQIALLTRRIQSLTEHFKSHVKDHSSRRGLLMLVGQRRRLLTYLKRVDRPRYSKLIGDLGLRK